MAFLQFHARASNPADDIVADLSRVTPSQGRDLALQLPDLMRAHLAVLCQSRAHLREIGRAIASVCSQESLVEAGGYPGRALVERRQEALRAPSRRRATPPSGSSAFTAAADDPRNDEGERYKSPAAA